MAELRRALTLPLVTFYGIGTILGAGIYVLVGKVAGLAGLYTPISFIIASLIAALSAFSYCELSTRYPKSAGEAYYVEQALGMRSLSTLVGLGIIAAGVVSVATLLQGFAGYLDVFIELDRWLTITVLAMMVGAIVTWGISQSVLIASAMTLLEIAGLVLILWVTGDNLPKLADRWPELVPPLNPAPWQGIIAGTFIAFYAFIGFEDIVNVAEEVRDPEKNLPRAIVIALVVTSVFYILVAIASILSMPTHELAASSAPLAELYRQQTGNAPTVIALISLISILNGTIIQVIMASRVLYGMSNQAWLPGVLARVNKKTQTPVVATAVITALVLLFALWLPIVSLAKLTSFIVLCVFSLINLSLIILKRRPDAASTHFSVPMMVPIFGLLASLALLGFQLFSALR
jgi:basic amino acid/polyamine antiporter, APA family